jgi:hypothetical protein
MVFASRRTVELDQQLGGQESLLDKRRIARRCFASSRLVLLRTRMVPLVTRSNVTSQPTQADPTFPRWAIALVAPTSLRARSGWRPRDAAAAGSGAIGLPRYGSPAHAATGDHNAGDVDRLCLGSTVTLRVVASSLCVLLACRSEHSLGRPLPANAIARRDDPGHMGDIRIVRALGRPPCGAAAPAT